MNPKIYPVIHYLDWETTYVEVVKAINCGADGVFLISHRNNDDDIIESAQDIRIRFPDFPVGINFLSKGPSVAARICYGQGFHMMWGDNVGVSSSGVVEPAMEIHHFQHGGNDSKAFEVFASVAFKYQQHEPRPEVAARVALEMGFIPTTSGAGTGEAPGLMKIANMSRATDGVLAVASGMTPENVSMYAPYLSHILVATGVALDEHRLDPDKLRLLIENSKGPHKIMVNLTLNLKD